LASRQLRVPVWMRWRWWALTEINTTRPTLETHIQNSSGKKSENTFREWDSIAPSKAQRPIMQAC
jgi:hypothetical protein